MNLLKKTSIYTIGILLEKGGLFLLIPIYTSYLSTSDYGVLAIVQSVIAITIILFSLSLIGSASRFYFDGKEKYRKYHYGNIITYVTFFSIVGSLILYIFSEQIFKYIGNIPTSPYLYLIIIITYATIVYNLYQLKLQMEHLAKKYVINNIIKFLFSSAITIYFLSIFKMGADGVLLANALVLSIFCIFFLYKFNQEYIFNTNNKILRKNLSYSLFLIPHNLAGVLNLYIDRFFISSMISMSFAGVYALGSQIAGVIGIFAAAINTALVPATLKSFKDKDYAYLVNLANLTIGFISIMAVTISLFSNEIISLVAPSTYSESSFVVSVLSFNFLFQMYYYRVVGVLFYDTKATKLIPIITVFSTIINIALNLFLINKFGYIGAAISTTITMMLVTYFVIYFSNRYIKIDFNHKKLHIIIISAVIVSVLFYKYNFLIKAFLVVFFILIYLYIDRDNELHKEFIDKYLHKGDKSQ